MSDDNLEKPAEVAALYDAVFPNIEAWAMARRAEGAEAAEEEYISAAKGPVVPFAPLQREIGVSFIETEKFVPLTKVHQGVIFQWVESVTQPYDMIQRAEGWSNPYKVYNGAVKNFLEHAETPNDTETIKDAHASGRAAVRRHFETTKMHHDIARDRFKAGQFANRYLIKGAQVVHSTAVDEILQELANGVAANLDENFPGGDASAKVAGNSILRVKDVLVSGEATDPRDYVTLLAAGLNYVKLQGDGWETALNEVRQYAAKNKFEIETTPETS